LRRLHLVDEVIPEPLGGAHRDPAAAIQSVGDAMARALVVLLPVESATLKARRREKFLNMGHEAFG